MRSLEEINNEYSKTVAELGVLTMQEYELPDLKKDCRVKILELKAEYQRTAAALEQAQAVLNKGETK